MGNPTTAVRDTSIDCDDRRPQRWTPAKLARFLGPEVSARWARDQIPAMYRARVLHRVGRFHFGTAANVRRFFLGDLPARRRRAS